jgi:O-antigen/teichoic acid export membrane protein
MVSAFVLLPVNIRYLSPAEYGVISQATILQSYLQLILCFGLDAAVVRFFYDYNQSKAQLNKLLGTVVGLLMLLTLFVAALFWLGGKVVSDAMWNHQLDFDRYGWIIFFNTIGVSITGVVMQYFRAAQALRAVTLLSLSSFILSTLGGLIGVVWLQLGAYGSLMGKALGATLGVLPVIIWLLRDIRINLDGRLIKGLIRFSFPLFLYGTIGLLAQSIDKILISQQFTQAQLGVYNLASTIAVVVSLIQMAYVTAINPGMYQLLQEYDEAAPEVRQNLAARAKKQFQLLLTITTLLVWGSIMVVGPLLALLNKPAYLLSLVYLPMLCFAYYGRALYVVYSFQLFVHKRTGYLTAALLISLTLTTFLSVILSRSLGIIGITIGVVAYQFLLFGATILLYRPHYTYWFPLRPLFSWLLLPAIVVLLNYLLLFPLLKPMQVIVVNGIEGLAFCSYVVFVNRSHVKQLLPQVRALLGDGKK